MCEFSDLSNDRVACYTWLGNISAASVFSEPFSYYTGDNLLRWHRCKYSRSRITKGKLINEKHNFCTEDIHRAATALSRVNPQTPFLVRKKKKMKKNVHFFTIVIDRSKMKRSIHIKIYLWANTAQKKDISMTFLNFFIRICFCRFLLIFQRHLVANKKYLNMFYWKTQDFLLNLLDQY